MLKNIIKTLILFMIFAPAANAEPKPWFFPLGKGHYDRVFHEKYQPYLENGKHPHNTQWDYRDWYAEDWMAQVEEDKDLIDGFYRADIIRKQIMGNDIPVLVVGPGFYDLSGYDKRRVTHVVDRIYKITSDGRFKVYALEDWRTGRQIGLYTQYGLQIQ